MQNCKKLHTVSWQKNGDATLVKCVNRHHADWQQLFLVAADLHVDSTKARRNFLKRKLDKALAAQQKIFIFGDAWDVMQLPNDRRSSKDNLDPQLKTDAYLNHAVQLMVDFFAPYAPHIILWAPGNHETAVLKHANFDLVAEVTRRLNAEHGGHIIHGGYDGYIQFRFTEDYEGDHKQKSRTINAYYHHGYGGGQRSKGVLKVDIETGNRRSADIFFYGHIHQEWRVVKCAEDLTIGGKRRFTRVLHCQLPSFKTPGGWETEKGFMPLTQGAYQLKFYWDENQIMYDAITA